MLLESSAKSDPTNSSLCVYPLLSYPGTIEAPASGDLQKLSEWDPVTLYWGTCQTSNNQFQWLGHHMILNGDQEEELSAKPSQTLWTQLPGEWASELVFGWFS